MKLRNFFKVNPLMGFILAFILIVISFSVQLSMPQVFGIARFIILYPMSFFIVWIAGIRAGVFAIFLSIIGSLFLFQDAFRDHNAVLRIATFACSALFISWIKNSIINGFENEHDKLKDTLRSLDDLYQNTPCGLHTLDKNGNLMKINNTELVWLGYTSDELVGKHVTNIYSSETIKKLRKFQSNVLEKIKIENIEVELLHKDGSIITCLMNEVINFDEHGKFISTQSTLIDIREHLKTQGQVRIFKWAMDNSPISIELTDAENRIVYVNKKFEETTGYKFEEINGKNPSCLGKNLTPKETFREMWRSLNSKESWHGEFINKRKNGELFYEDAFISALFDRENKLSHYIALKNDITLKRNYEIKIKEQQQMLISSNRCKALGDMAASIAHEINNPLTIINLKTRVLIKKIESNNVENKDFMDSLKNIDATTKRIARIVNSLKLFTKNSDNDAMKMVSASYLMQVLLDLCQEDITRKNIALDLQIKDDFTFECNEGLVIQLLMNLIKNSITAVSKADEKWIKIEFTTDQYLFYINITDSGNGIDQNIIERLMEPFVTTNKDHSSLGLGLSIANGIANTHSGKLYFDKTCQFTRFVFSAPLIQPISKAA